jgi:hypothetical protein
MNVRGGSGMSECWGLSLDDLAEEIYQITSDAAGGHFVAFKGDKATARAKMIKAFTSLIDTHLYRANAYGSQWQEGDDNDD